MHKEFPTYRSVAVHNEGGTPPKISPQSELLADSVEEPGTVTVMGFDKNEVLLQSSKANVVQVRGSDGRISAMLVRLRPNIWGFCKSGDPDWNQMLALYGTQG